MKNAILVLSISLMSTAALAASKKTPTPRDAEVESVKDAYWNRNSRGEVEVVQNRAYTKSGRLSLQSGFGTVSSDPFLSVKAASAALGYHFSENWGVNLIGRKYLVSDSSYQNELQRGLVAGSPSIANVNRPQSYLGGEIEFSPLYGKISLSGTSVVHYDAHLFAGFGMTETDTGRLSTPSVGLGPQFYLSNTFALRVDYRLTYYKETVPERVLTSQSVAGERDNYSHQFTLGLVAFL